ncbi:hypothetical protein DFJ43DRAFT_1069921 [Lentinula guzmanii]|uniref:Uncharacterized protein n=1 Tax=Lentinula guzmanii TaxID=2804957 RepID=A0AA38N112_9AGAR|nr:hypothetical protein DFJ43DRAFT_1069921 [Lentinula guzmanii]
MNLLCSENFVQDWVTKTGCHEVGFMTCFVAKILAAGKKGRSIFIKSDNLLLRISSPRQNSRFRILLQAHGQRATMKTRVLIPGNEEFLGGLLVCVDVTATTSEFGQHEFLKKACALSGLAPFLRFRNKQAS